MIVGGDRGELLAGLRLLGHGEAEGGVLRGGVQLSLPAGGRGVAGGGVVFMFTGQGSQRLGMGGSLREGLPVFREAFDEVVAHLDGLLERPLREVLFAGPGSSEAALLDRTEFTQPALFAFEVALCRQMQSLGVEPDFLIGHSVGELVAVHVSGALGLQEACALVAARGRIMGALPADGAMAALQASEQQAQALLGGYEQQVSIAAVNAPGSVVISGQREEVREIAERCKQQGRKTKLLEVSHAFHSPLIEASLAELAELAGSLSFQAPRIPIVSNLTGELLSYEQLSDPGYWASHARQKVRFADGIRWLHEQGAKRYIELGPDGTLAASCHECLEEADEQQATVLAVARRGLGERESLLAAAGELWVDGAAIDWKELLKDSKATRVPLPSYAFQRERYWLDAPASRDLAAIGIDAAEHPLLGAAVPLADSENAENGMLFTARISLQSHPWLADHVVMGAVVLPGSALLEMALHAGIRTHCPIVEELTLQAPLILDSQQATQIQLTISEPDQQGARQIKTHSRPQHPTEQGQHDWTLHATGTLAPQTDKTISDWENDPDTQQANALLAGDWPPPNAEAIDLTDLYPELQQLGLAYGPSFQGLTAAWRTPTHLLAEATLPKANTHTAHTYNLHPALLDAALHTLTLDTLTQNSQQTPPQIHLPFTWQNTQLHQPPTTTLRIALTHNPNQTATLHLTNQTGTPTATITELATRAASPEQLALAGRSAAPPLYELQWTEAPAPSGAGAVEDWHVVARRELRALSQALHEAGGAVQLHDDLDALVGSLSRLEGSAAGAPAAAGPPAATEEPAAGGTALGATAVALVRLDGLDAWAGWRRRDG